MKKLLKTCIFLCVLDCVFALEINIMNKSDYELTGGANLSHCNKKQDDFTFIEINQYFGLEKNKELLLEKEISNYSEDLSEVPGSSFYLFGALKLSDNKQRFVEAECFQNITKATKKITLTIENNNSHCSIE